MLKKKTLAKSLTIVDAEILNWQNRLDSLSPEIKNIVSEFYQHDGITRIAPGKWDIVIVPGKNGKEKLQRRHLFVHIKKTYALFKDEYTGVKIDIRKFKLLQPPEVSSNIYTCIYHQNKSGCHSCLLVSVSHLGLTNGGTFWAKSPKTTWKLQNHQFWGKTVEGQANFLGSVGIPPSLPSTGKTLLTNCPNIW